MHYLLTCLSESPSSQSWSASFAACVRLHRSRLSTSRLGSAEDHSRKGYYVKDKLATGSLEKAGSATLAGVYG